jgi:hypothetical protein
MQTRKRRLGQEYDNSFWDGSLLWETEMERYLGKAPSPLNLR